MQQGHDATNDLRAPCLTLHGGKSSQSNGDHGAQCHQTQNPMDSTEASSSEFLNENRIDPPNARFASLRINQKENPSKRLDASRLFIRDFPLGARAVEDSVIELSDGRNGEPDRHGKAQHHETPRHRIRFESTLCPKRRMPHDFHHRSKG